MKIVTPRTFPLDQNGCFQSEAAEFAYQNFNEEMSYGNKIDREDIRIILQSYLYIIDKLAYRRLQEELNAPG